MTWIKRTFTVLILALILFASVQQSHAAPIKIVHSATMPPLSFINEDGVADGIIPDLWRAWSKQSSIPVVFDLMDWKKALEKTMLDNNAINGGLFYTSRRAEKLIFADSLFSMQGALFINKDLLKNGKAPNLEHKVCGVLKAGYSKFYMETRSPYTSLMLFDSMEDLINSVSADKVKVFVADYPVAIYKLHEHGLEKKFKCTQILYEQNLFPAVSSQHKELVKTINHYMAEIPKHHKDQIIKKWLNVQTQTSITTKVIIILAFIVVIVFFLLNKPFWTAFHKKD